MQGKSFSHQVVELWIEMKIKTLDDSFDNPEITSPRVPVAGVYLLVHSVTKETYIGSTENLYVRKYKHIWHIKNGTHRNSKVRKAYEKNPTDQIYFLTWLTESKSSALELEQKFLDLYHDHPLCLNISAYAEKPGRGVLHSKQTRENNSSAVKELWKDSDYRTKRSVALKRYYADPDARKRSSETAKKMFKNNDGLVEHLRIKANVQWSNPEARLNKAEQVRQYALINNRKVVVNKVEYPHMAEAARVLNIDYKTLEYRVNNPRSKWSDYKYLET